MTQINLFDAVAQEVTAQALKSNSDAAKAALGTTADAAAANGDGTLLGYMRRLRDVFLPWTRPPANNAGGIAVRPITMDNWAASFALSGATLNAPELQYCGPVGAGVAVSQASAALNIAMGTGINAECLIRSKVAFSGVLTARHSTVLSQRIASNNFAVLLADLIGDNLALVVNSAVSVTVTVPGHGFNMDSVGQSVFIGAISGVAGVPGRYAIADVPGPDQLTLTVSGWPAAGAGTATLFGRNFIRTLYDGTTATTAKIDAARAGWASGDTAISTYTTAAPGHVMMTDIRGQEVYWGDYLRASNTAYNPAQRGGRAEKTPASNVDLYLFIWGFNGPAAPASSTTWTISLASIEQKANQHVMLAGTAPQASQTVLHSTLMSSGSRLGFTQAYGINYDDSSTPLAAGASFTGAWRDLFGVAPGTAFNAISFAQEFRASAVADQPFTLYVDQSRDSGVTPRRIKPVVAALTGGLYYAEISHMPTRRHARVAATNTSAAAMTFFELQSVAMGA